MAEFSENLKSFKSSLPFLDMYSSNIEYINQFTELNATAMENTNYNLPSLMGFSNDNFLTQQSEFTASLNENFASLHASDCLTSAPIAQSIASMEDVDQERKKKRKAMTISESSSGVTSTPVSESGSGENDKRKRKNVCIALFCQFSLFGHFVFGSLFWWIGSGGMFGFDFTEFRERKERKIRRETRW